MKKNSNSKRAKGKKHPKKAQQNNNGICHRKYFTSRKGKKIFARDYGYESWPIGKRK